MTLATPRLVLRPWTVEDLDLFHRLRRDPQVARYLYADPLSRDQAREKLAARLADEPRPGQWLNLAVDVADTGGFAGEVGLCWHSDVHHQVEIGYAFLPTAGGRGYATEAVAAMVDLAVERLGAHRIFGRMDARNRASARLLERLGFRREAHLVGVEQVKGEWTDELVYAVLASEWLAARDASTTEGLGGALN